VAKLGVAQFEDAGQHPRMARELRLAIAEAEDGPEDSAAVEDLREFMMSVPELEALLRKEFPEGVHPLPFHLQRGRYMIN
jgi:hypothetical protein